MLWQCAKHCCKYFIYIIRSLTLKKKKRNNGTAHILEVKTLRHKTISSRDADNQIMFKRKKVSSTPRKYRIAFLELQLTYSIKTSYYAYS